MNLEKCLAYPYTYTDYSRGSLIRIWRDWSSNSKWWVFWFSRGKWPYMGYVPNVGYLDFKKDNKRTLAETHGNYSMEHTNAIRYDFVCEIIFIGEKFQIKEILSSWMFKSSFWKENLIKKLLKFCLIWSIYCSQESSKVILTCPSHSNYRIKYFFFTDLWKKMLFLIGYSTVLKLGYS